MCEFFSDDKDGKSSKTRSKLTDVEEGKKALYTAAGRGAGPQEEAERRTAGPDSALKSAQLSSSYSNSTGRITMGSSSSDTDVKMREKQEQSRC